MLSAETHWGNREASGEESYGRFLYNQFRYYDPGIGRYVSADPIGQAGGSNLYRYAWNNPLRYYDLFGLDATDYYNNRGGRPPGMLPTNGNWGGKCWSGGQYSCGGRGMGNAPPTDSADQCYEAHDKCYSTCKNQAQKDSCDADLVACLNALDDDPTKWPNPPRPGTEEDSARYRRWAIQTFD